MFYFWFELQFEAELHMSIKQYITITKLHYYYIILLYIILYNIIIVYYII